MKKKKKIHKKDAFYAGEMVNGETKDKVQKRWIQVVVTWNL